MGRSIPYGEAILLVNELLKEQGSHFFAAMAEWNFPLSRSEFYLAGLFSRVVNISRGERDEPLVIDWPWDKPAETEPEVSDDERSVLIARLRASSAIRGVRTPEGVDDGR